LPWLPPITIFSSYAAGGLLPGRRSFALYTTFSLARSGGRTSALIGGRAIGRRETGAERGLSGRFSDGNDLNEVMAWELPNDEAA